MSAKPSRANTGPSNCHLQHRGPGVECTRVRWEADTQGPGIPSPKEYTSVRDSGELHGAAKQGSELIEKVTPSHCARWIEVEKGKGAGRPVRKFLQSFRPEMMMKHQILPR